MLGLITGVPGAKKTVFTVSMLDKIESENKVNLTKNKAVFEYNQKIIAKDGLENELTYFFDEVGSGHDLKQVMTILQDDYFNMMLQDYEALRPDNYYQVATIYNAIINRILETKPKIKLKYLQPVRTIYTNINALKIDFVRSLYDLLDEKGNVDWRKAPDGSIIVIDEIQLVEPFKQTKNKDEPIIQDLTIHRHRGFDFYFITQSANLLHVQIKDLIGLHWHITVPWGWVSKVYQYGSYRQNPNAVSIKMSAERKFNFSPPDRLFKLYKSTTINTHKKRIPYRALILFTLVIFFAVGMFFWAVGGSKDSVLMTGMMGKQVNLESNLQANSLKNPPIGQKVDDPAASSKPVINEAGTSETTVSNINGSSSPAPVSPVATFDPLSGDYIQDVNLVPVSGMSMNGKCSVYNKDGLLLTHISQSDCTKYLENKGMLPVLKT